MTTGIDERGPGLAVAADVPEARPDVDLAIDQADVTIEHFGAVNAMVEYLVRR